MKKIFCSFLFVFVGGWPWVAEAEFYYYHQDHLGGSSVITDEDGEIVAEYEYYPYGEGFSETGELENFYKFTDQEEDSETGLYYYGARYYDPEVASFYSQDPAVYDERLFEMLSDPQMLNSYAYVRNNPVKYVDPSGEDAYEVTGYFTMVMNYSAHDVSWMKNLSMTGKLLNFGIYVTNFGDIKNTTFLGIDYLMDSVIVGGNEYASDVLGNIMFGYIGSSIGLNENMLRGGAGLYEFFQGLTNKGVDIQWGYFYSLFDDPADQEAISIGIQMYLEYGDNLTEEQIIAALEGSGLELEESRADNVCYDQDEKK